MKKIVCTFEGGGARGLIQMIFMQALHKLCLEKKGVDLEKHVYMYSGTSVGGLNAALLANGYTYEEVKSLYDEKVHHCFKKNALQLIEPKFDKKLFHESMDSLFQTEDYQKISWRQLEKKALLISRSLENATQTIWTNLDVGQNDGTTGFKTKDGYIKNIRDVSVVDSLVSCCSATTYFASHNVEIDNGLFRNTPVLETLSALIKQDGQSFNIKDYHFLLVGAGDAETSLSALEDGSALATLKNIIAGGGDNLLEAIMKKNKIEINDYFEEFVKAVGGTCSSIQILIDSALLEALSDQSVRQKYKDLADDFIQDNHELFQTIADALVASCT